MIARRVTRNRIAAAIGVALFALCAMGWRDTMADPVVRTATVALAGYPAGAPPIRIALLSDVHTSGPDMPPLRVRRIAAQVNAPAPDLILIAGDFIGTRTLATRRYSIGESIAPLAGLHARLGVHAVLGNHDDTRPDVWLITFRAPVTKTAAGSLRRP